MATNNKKCTFAKPGKRTHQLGKHKRKGKALSSNERAKKLSEWRKNIW